MKRKGKNKFIGFLEEKGFYIILILCIAAVGVSGYVLFFSGDDAVQTPLLQNPVTFPPENQGSVTKELQATIPPEVMRETEVTMAPETPEPTTAPNKDVVGLITGENDEADTSKNAELETLGSATEVSGNVGGDKEGTEASFFVWPVNGEILTSFSVDELVFNRTLGDWRVHTGADIAANLGAEVSSIGDGVVEDVYMSEMMGMTVVIDHGAQTKSVYQNLMENVTVSIGDKVSAGQVIGGIGQTAENEVSESPHLHLEVIRAGGQIDPMELLP